MNKCEIVQGLYRQNVYNVNLGDNHYNHVTCYFDKHTNIVMMFSAGVNLNMTNFIEDTSLIPLTLSIEVTSMIKNILLSYTYSHIEAVDLYNPDSMWNRDDLKHIFGLTPRDNFVIKHWTKITNIF